MLGLKDGNLYEYHFKIDLDGLKSYKQKLKEELVKEIRYNGQCQTSSDFAIEFIKNKLINMRNVFHVSRLEVKEIPEERIGSLKLYEYDAILLTRAKICKVLDEDEDYYLLEYLRQWYDSRSDSEFFSVSQKEEIFQQISTFIDFDSELKLNKQAIEDLQYGMKIIGIEEEYEDRFDDYQNNGEFVKALRKVKKVNELNKQR